MDIGVVFVLAVGSLAAYGIVLGGWSSNNKYSFLGALRSSAQLISYEIPMGMSILGVFLVTGSLNAERIIDHQAHQGWNLLFQPVACLLFITSVFAETNRVPFDLPEAEQELVGGYHTEYSGMKFALFFLGEYTHMITTSFLVIALFFGGWHLPFGISGLEGVPGMVVKLIIFAGKMGLFIIFYMFIRWTIPRFRFDQLMGLAWKVMMPLALVSLLIVLFVRALPAAGERVGQVGTDAAAVTRGADRRGAGLAADAQAAGEGADQLRRAPDPRRAAGVGGGSTAAARLVR
ncbi:MAG: complex I subunit 1 family protein [Gemmataceae bacterium]